MSEASCCTLVLPSSSTSADHPPSSSCTSSSDPLCCHCKTVLDLPCAWFANSGWEGNVWEIGVTVACIFKIEEKLTAIWKVGVATILIVHGGHKPRKSEHQCQCTYSNPLLCSYNHPGTSSIMAASSTVRITQKHSKNDQLCTHFSGVFTQMITVSAVCHVISCHHQHCLHLAFAALYNLPCRGVIRHLKQ